MAKASASTVNWSRLGSNSKRLTWTCEIRQETGEYAETKRRANIGALIAMCRVPEAQAPGRT